MKDEKIRIDADPVDALSRELERDLQAPAADADSKPRRSWTDAFSASGDKHAMV
jgi:hypothetical protein